MMDTLPLFPLGSVVLPGAPLPLHIFEPRYRQLTVDLMDGTVPDRRFGVIAIRQGWEVGEHNVDALYEIGCSVQVRQVRQLPAGHFALTADGEQRFQLRDVDRESAPYLVGTVQWLPDAQPDTDSKELQRQLAASALAAHHRYHEAGARREAYRVPPDVAIDKLAYALADSCVLSTEDRQDLLAETDPLARLRLVRGLLLRESEFLRTLRAVPAPLQEFAQVSTMN
jgi:Lon protease-like protein